MTAVLPPLFIQVALTFAIGLVMGVTRVSQSLRDPEVMSAVRAGRSDVYGRTALLMADNFRNQFEVPVLFYAAVLLAIAAGRPISDGFVTLAWVFAISRIVHAGIHCSVNIVALRFLAFLVGVIAAILMWIELYTSLLAG